MIDTQEPTREQQDELIIKALELSGFEFNEFIGIYVKPYGDKQIVVDLKDGKHGICFNVDKKAVIVDDEDGTLAHIADIMTDAMVGKMPTKSEPDEVVNVSNKDETAPAPETPKKDIKDTEDTPSEPAPVDNPPTELIHSTAPPAPFVPQGTMIQGLIPGLKEVGKIKIGKKGAMKTSKKGNEFRPPEMFDHFEVVTLYKDDNGDFIPDVAIMDKIGGDAKELEITLLYDDPTLNFYTQYNQYKGGKRICSGNGVDAIQTDGTKIKCNPDTCTIFKAKHCKPNGILSVILKDAPQLGGVYKFRTTSFNSIRAILSSMFFIQSLTGGILANIPLKMTIAPMSVNPVGSPTAQTIFVVNLIYPGTVDDLRKETLQLMTEKAGMHSKMIELEAQARVAISAPETKEEIQDVEHEFYPDTVKEEAT